MADESELLAFSGEVRRCWGMSQTPPDLQASYLAWSKENKHHIDRLRAIIAATAAWWIIKGREDGHDQNILDQIALQSTQWAIAVIARAMKLRQGEKFEPARVAIVAYAVAKQVADSDSTVDLEGLTQATEAISSDVEAENERLRDLISRIGNGNMAADEIRERCREVLA